MSSYLYDATSGFYYDPETTLYYDPGSRVGVGEDCTCSFYLSTNGLLKASGFEDLLLSGSL